MKQRKIIILILSLVAALFVGSFFVGADHAVYVNGSSNRLRGLFSENFAIGSSGISKLDYDDVYVLTASGVKNVSSLSAEGGGGLLFDDGRVKIKSDIIKVGLSFNFNRADTDTTVSEATFENRTGNGFAFGYYDDDRDFVELDCTDSSTIYVYPIEDYELYLGIFDEYGDLIYDTSYPNTKENFIAIHPLSDGGETTTWYGGYKYFGDFEVGFTAGEGFTVINTLPIQPYLKGVIAVEMVSDAPLDAYKAQAVAARSYAQRCIRNTDLYTEYGFDLTNNTYYQAYYGYYVPSQANYTTISRAVDETANEYLTYNGYVINALYCAANGGQTMDGGYPYLKGFEDPYEGAVWTKGPYGHQFGMSQWGAYAMAKYYNKDYKSILGFYYTKVGISYGYVG